MNVKFGDLIRNYRKQSKLTQIEFGNIISKSQVTISAYEKNKHFPTSANEIDDVARAIDQPVATVIAAIKYAQTGENNDSRVLVDINSNDSVEELKSMYKFVIDGVEATDEELEELVYQILFNRFKNNKRMMMSKES